METSKECPSCGAQNDVLFTNCVYCKTPLPNVDVNSLTNEDLVMQASEWVSKASVPLLVMQGPNANEWTGKGIARMMQAEVVAYAEKYMNLLELRASSNSTLDTVYQKLKIQLEENKKKGEPNKLSKSINKFDAFAENLFGVFKKKKVK